MTQLTDGAAASRGGHLPILGAVLGLSAGLLEGVGHMLLLRLEVLDNSWYPIIWIAAVFNGLLVGAAGVAAAAMLAVRPASSRLRRMAVFSLFTLAVVPVLALMLKEWIYQYAIVLLILGTATALTRWYFRHESWVLRTLPRALRWSAGISLIAFATIEGGAWLQERLATAGLPRANAASPNVLLIVVDTLRSDHLASYGYSRHTSPTIDALAAEGVLFENSFSTSSYTLPSHASILTGRYPRDHQVEWDTSHRPRNPDVPTLPQVLQSQGYRTGAFSANTFYFTREHGFGKGFLHFEDFFHSLEDMAWRTAYGGIVTRLVRPRLGFEDLPGRKNATDVSGAALDWINRDAERPFFVTMNFLDAHDPYLPPQPYRSQFSTTLNPGGLLNSKLHTPPSLTAQELQGEIDAYDGGIAYIDAQVSRLLSKIQARDRGRPLLIIVTSDHGEEFGEHGGFIHGNHLYREVIQVPLIIWEPGRVPHGKRLSQPVSNAAIPATVMGLLGAGAGTFHVPSLVPLWEGTQADFPMPLSELKHKPWEKDPNSPIRFGSMRSLVDPSWHYIEQDGRGHQLFAWPTDPREATDLAARPDLQDVAERLKKLIK